MKELTLIFNSMREAEYHFANLKNKEYDKKIKINYVQRKPVMEIDYEYYDNSRFNFIQKLFGKKDIILLKVYFKSRRSNFVGNFTEVEQIYRSDIETEQMYNLILKKYFHIN